MAHHFILLRLNPFGLRVDGEGWWFEHSMSWLRVSLSAEGAKNVSWPWLSPLRGWVSLTMTSTGKFTYIYIYIYIYIYTYILVILIPAFLPMRKNEFYESDCFSFLNYEGRF